MTRQNQTIEQKPTKMFLDLAWPYIVTHPIAGAITLNSVRKIDKANRKLEQIALQGDTIDKGNNADEKFANECVHYYRKSILEQEANPINMVGSALFGYVAQLLATPLITYSLTGSSRATIASLVAQVGATIATGYLAYRKCESLERKVPQ